MVLPVPSWLLDIGVSASFSLAILMLVVTLFIEKPLDFSAFPTILIGALILRLSLNVASTKLIIGEGHSGTDAAGSVIEGFAMFIMSGNLAIGLVVFCVLLIVNFVVINKGATRMAEVGARFALDAMPGKQLAIDSDIASGAISHDEGRKRRDTEQAETTFFGSLDGTSKFVKGDAIAGLIITLLNLVVGILMGLFGHGMGISDSFATYSILTVGDGLVSQIPAVLVSIATAVLLARGGTTGTTSHAVGDQLSRHPTALLLVAVFLAGFGLIPGLPFGPFVSLSLILFAIGIWLLQRDKNMKLNERNATPTAIEATPTERISDLLEIEDIQIVFSPSLIPMVLDPNSGLEGRIKNIRKHIAQNFGVLVPEVHLTDNVEIADCEYKISILGIEVGRFKLEPHLKLAINPNTTSSNLNGESVYEPVYGAPAKWLDEDASEVAVLTGQTIIDPPEIIATHLLHTLTENLTRIFTYSNLQERINQMSNITGNDQRSQQNKAFLDALIPEKVTVELLYSILRELLLEKVSIRNLRLIIESIAEARQSIQNFDQIYTHIRIRLATQIIEPALDKHRKLNVIQVSQSWYDTFTQYSLNGTDPNGFGLPPDLVSELIHELQETIRQFQSAHDPLSILCQDRYRPYIRDVLRSARQDLHVFSFSEIATGCAVNVIGHVGRKELV